MTSVRFRLRHLRHHTCPGDTEGLSINARPRATVPRCTVLYCTNPIAAHEPPSTIYGRLHRPIAVARSTGIEKQTLVRNNQQNSNILSGERR